MNNSTNIEYKHCQENLNFYQNQKLARAAIPRHILEATHGKSGGEVHVKDGL
jgi:hypothetical protein